eukprot:jgi/Mesvir1/10815/Mv21211-RA.1
MKTALRVSSLDVSSVWVVTQENGAVVARKAGDQRESVSIGQSSASILSDVSATADLRTGGRVHLPQGDYSGAAPQSLVPRSYVSRAPAFLYGLNHSSVTDTAHYSAPPDAGSLLVRTGDGLWGPQAATVTPYYHRHRVFTAAIPWAETQTPAFRYASFGCPPAGQAVAALNAFPHTASTCIYEVAVCLNNLQIGSGGGGNLITVTVRVHDTAVDTGLYEDEVHRQTDVASDEAVSANGYFADGRWNWKKAVTWAGAGQIAMNPGSAYRVSVKVALASPVAQTDTNTYATVQLKTLSSSFNLQTFGGSVPAPTATSTQISHSRDPLAHHVRGRQLGGPVPRVQRLQGGAGGGRYIHQVGAGGTDLVASSAFPMSGDGTVGSGPLGEKCGQVPRDQPGRRRADGGGGARGGQDVRRGGGKGASSAYGSGIPGGGQDGYYNARSLPPSVQKDDGSGMSGAGKLLVLVFVLLAGWLAYYLFKRRSSGAPEAIQLDLSPMMMSLPSLPPQRMVYPPPMMYPPAMMAGM